MKTGDADDVFVCHDHLVRYWQHQLAKRLIDIGSRQSVCSTDLTSELESGCPLAVACWQEKAANAICGKECVDIFTRLAEMKQYIFCKRACTCLIRTWFIHAIHLSVYLCVLLLGYSPQQSQTSAFYLLIFGRVTLCSIARARGTALRARQHRHSIGRVRILLERYSNYSYVLQILGGITYCIQS